MKGLTIALALVVIASLNAAGADDLAAWKTSPAGKCLLDRGDGKLANFAAADANCGPIGDSSRAPRAFVLSNEFEGVIRAIRLGDSQGVKTLMSSLWQTQNRSPQFGSCWKTMVKTCDAEQIGEAIEAAKP